MRIGAEMKVIKRLISLMIIVIIASSSTTIVASASANYSSYTYNEWDESAAAPESYNAALSKTGLMLGCGALKEPQDMYMKENGELYIADTGNNRLVVVDRYLNLIKVIDKVTNNGIEENVIDPQGLYISSDETIYISQPSLERVILVKDGNIISVIEKPEHNLISEDFVFQPTKIGVDIYGRAYVLSKGCYIGLLQFDTNGQFVNFFGANKVEITPKILIQYMWKNILTDDQRNAMTSILPIEYSNLDCSTDGFVYSTTVGTSTPFKQVKKLNPLGNNTYFGQGNREINFGDFEVSYSMGSYISSSFIDVKVDKEGFIYGLDITRGRVFERDQEGNLIAVFGGLGNQLGTFSTAIAIEAYAGNVFVLDSLKNNVVMFEPTEYGTMVREATIQYQEGMYLQSVEIWKQVLKRNSNNTLAYTGLGKALSQNGEHKEALKYLKAGGARYSYSRSFSKMRLDIIRTYAPYVTSGLVILLVGLNVIKIIYKVKKNRRKER